MSLTWSLRLVSRTCVKGPLTCHCLSHPYLYRWSLASIPSQRQTHSHCSNKNVPFLAKSSHLWDLSLTAPLFHQPSRCASKLPEVKPPSKVKLRLLRPYMRMMERMEVWLEKKYPKAHNIYMLFKIGLQDIFADTKMYYRVALGLRTDDPISNFSRKELECYRQIPRDMLKVAPVLLISALPFMNYVIFPIAYFFPRHLLCRHFWTAQQRVDFAHTYLSHRVTHYPKIFKYMEKHARDIKEQGNRDLFLGIMKKIEQEKQLTHYDVIRLKPLFERRPFSLRHLSSLHKLHTRHLSKSLNLSTMPTKMAAEALLIHHIDLAIDKEGLDCLSMEDLQQACFTRGLDAKGTSRTDLEKYLKQWLQVSRTIDERSLSLLVHCPVLLAYNHPANKHFKKDNIEFDDI